MVGETGSSAGDDERINIKEIRLTTIFFIGTCQNLKHAEAG